MSASLAAAKKRRANIQEPTRVGGNGAESAAPPIAAGLTLPQVIQIVDNRLITLEKFMRETKESGIPLTQKSVSFSPSGVTPSPDAQDGSSSEGSSPIDISEIVEEFDNRYKMLAEEIANLKNIVLSLQSYTMEVNKTLLEERVRIFSDLDQPLEKVETNVE